MTATKRLHKENIFWIVVLHLMTIVAIPFYSNTALIVCLVLLFGISSIGINLTYHRLLSHRAFEVPKWLEYIFASIGAMSAQGPMLLWVAEHRLHHRYSDEEKDPHNSRKGFFYAHMGHLFYHKEFEDNKEQWLKYVPDLAKDKYYQFISKYWLLYAITPGVILFLIGGWSFLLWGGFVRIVLMLHVTWLVNSASHMWGPQPYKTGDNSRNCWWVGVIAAGEGWHNNHHAFPACAAHGRKWWQIDTTYYVIRTLEFLGLAKNVKKPVEMEVEVQAATA